MRDNIRTPPGTETVCKRAADEVGELLRGTELYAEKSLFEMLMSLRRLLIDTSIATAPATGATRARPFLPSLMSLPTLKLWRGSRTRPWKTSRRTASPS
jgi:hypothetical protein